MITRAWFISRAKIYVAMFLAVMVLFFILTITDAIWRYAYAQDNHELHHAQYEQWWSNEGINCCNNNDCGALPESRVRGISGHIEVLVLDDTDGDQWCPVEERHLINQKSGKRPSPDWNTDHACIVNHSLSPGGVCAKLKCFMEKGKF